MRFEGTLTTWDDARGFGFLRATQGGDEVFVHIKAFRGQGRRPQVGDRLTFEVEPGPQGKKRAKKVEPLRVVHPRRRRHDASPAAWGTVTLLAIPLFLALSLLLSVLWRVPGSLFLGYAAASGITFIAYAMDKSAARQGTRRTPEATLHLLALAGGWPGALLAQQYLRHKSTKREFRQVFWVTVWMNVGGLVALCSPYGQPLWRPLA